MDTPNWRQIVGGAVGITLLGTIGYFGQARVRTNAAPQSFSSSKSKSPKKSTSSRSVASNSESPSDGDFNMPPPKKMIKVDIAGEIEKPGVYEISEGLRTEDLVKLAGGLTSEADRVKLNMAFKLKDGSKVIITAIKKPKPRSSTAKHKSNSVESENKVSQATLKAINPRGRSKSGGSRSTRKEAPPRAVSINSATENELQAVPGIGPSMAKRIVDFRISNGSFLTIDDLRKVHGIGEKAFDKIRDWITL